MTFGLLSHEAHARVQRIACLEKRFGRNTGNIRDGIHVNHFVAEQAVRTSAVDDLSAPLFAIGDKFLLDSLRRAGLFPLVAVGALSDTAQPINKETRHQTLELASLSQQTASRR